MSAATAAPGATLRAGPGIAAPSCPCAAGAAPGRQLCPHDLARERREKDRAGKRRGRGAGRGRGTGRGREAESGSTPSARPPALPGPPSGLGRASQLYPALVRRERLRGASFVVTTWQGKEGQGKGTKRRGRGSGRCKRSGKRKRRLSAASRPQYETPPLPAIPARGDDALPPASPAPPPPGRRCSRHFAALSLPLSRRGGCGRTSVF